MNLAAALTPREYEVTEWIASGAIKKEVAAALGISIRTVENIVRSIYEKTETHCVGQLATWYYHREYNVPIKKLQPAQNEKSKTINAE